MSQDRTRLSGCVNLTPADIRRLASGWACRQLTGKLFPEFDIL
jgi:hypothetical protein